METARVRIFGAAVVVSLAMAGSFVISTLVASRAYLKRGEQLNGTSRTLEVMGSARRRIFSDLALWSIRVAGEGKTLEEAYEKLHGSVEKVRGFLSEQGFPAECVTLGPISTTPHHRRDEKGQELREVVSYELGQTFLVRTGEVKRVEKAAGQVTELVKGGAHVESLPPQFVYMKLQDLKSVMVGEATANARERGDMIARESRCRVGAVKDARAGVLQITPPWSSEVAPGGMNDTSSIEKDITSVVHLTLLIESP
jgi:hypothetical protein